MSGPDLVTSAEKAPSPGLRILELIAENVKRIEVIEIRPDGDVVEITGKNGSGKTSCLDAIWWALAGTRNIQEEPIRRGADEALIQLDLGEFIIRRTLRNGDAGVTTSLSVLSPTGAEYRRPQATVDGFFNALSLDPLAFLRMETKEQFSLLRQFVPDVDFDEIEDANAKDYAARRDLNVIVKQQRALVSRFTVPDQDDLPEQPVDVAALQSELEAAGRHNGEIETRQARREAVEQSMEVKRRRAVEMADQAHALARQAEQIGSAAAALNLEADELAEKLRTAPPLPDPIDPALILADLAEAARVNAAIDLVRQRIQAEAEAKRTEAASKALTDAMAQRLKDTTEKIAAASLPVEGLSLTPAGGVMLNGFPFAQASDAEQLRASIRLAMAMSPRLRVIRVRDGSLLDEDGMGIIRDMARENGFQVWIERVASDSPTGFELVEGRLRKAKETKEAAHA